MVVFFLTAVLQSQTTLADIGSHVPPHQKGSHTSLHAGVTLGERGNGTYSYLRPGKDCACGGTLPTFFSREGRVMQTLG